MIKTFNRSTLSEEGRILVAFKAPWCQPCKSLEPTLETLSEEGYRVYDVNTDEEPELTVKYQIRSVPTMIIFENGIQIEVINGVKPKSKLIEALEN